MGSIIPTRETVPLNGIWKIKYDLENVGKEKKWYERGKIYLDKAEEIPVPAFWDEYNDEDHTVAWYFKTFHLPESWEGKIVEIRFGAVDYLAEVWLNGIFIGSHEGGYTPFTLNMENAAEGGTANFLAARVIHPRKNKPIEGIHLAEIPQGKEITYYTFAGIWQDVTITALSRINIQDVFIKPDIDAKKVAVSFTLRNCGEKIVSCALLNVVSPSKTLESPLITKETQLKLEPGMSEIDIELAFAPEMNLQLWSHKTPYLYMLTSRLIVNNSTVDEQTIDFGMRKFTIENNKFFLNNEEIFIRAALFQPDYGMTFAYPKDVQFARQEIEYAKQAGFNALRMHLKTPPESFVEQCDKLGILLYVEPPIAFIKASANLARRCLNEVREMVLTLRNHPSVVMWGMLNEGSNLNYVTHGAQDVKDELCLEARKFDPTRPIIDDSGGANNSKDPGHFYLPNSTEPVEFQDLHLYQRGPTDADIRDYYRFIHQPGQMSFTSEFGFGGLEDIPSLMSEYEKQGKTHLKDYKLLSDINSLFMKVFKANNLNTVFKDFSDFIRQAQELQASTAPLHMDALRLNPTMAGYCYTQFNDCGLEISAGVVDRLRRPKKVYDVLTHTQTDITLALWCERKNVFTGEPLEFHIHIISENALPNNYSLNIDILDPEDSTILNKKEVIEINKGVKELNFSSPNLTNKTGTYKLHLSLNNGDKSITSRTSEFTVVQKEKITISKKIALLAPEENLESFLKENSIEYDLYSNVKDDFDILLVPKIANTIWAYPLKSLLSALSLVEDGKTVIFFELPLDAGEFFCQLGENVLEFKVQESAGGFMGVFHIIRNHPIFKGLPSNSIMDECYYNVCPAFGLVLQGGDNIVGSINTMNIAAGNFMIEADTKIWIQELCIHPFGIGHIVFNQLRLLDNIKNDSIAWKVMTNLLKFLDESPLVKKDIHVAFDEQFVKETLEVINKLDEAKLQEWYVLGPFPNPLGKGLDVEYPPEKDLDLTKRYQGIFKEIGWQKWYTKKSDNFKINFADVFTPIYCFYPRYEYWVAYAYTSYECPKDGEYELEVTSEDGCKVWINDKVIFINKERRPAWLENPPKNKRVTVTVKKGINSILAKVEKTSGPSSLQLVIHPTHTEC